MFYTFKLCIDQGLKDNRICFDKESKSNQLSKQLILTMIKEYSKLYMGNIMSIYVPIGTKTPPYFSPVKIRITDYLGLNSEAQQYYLKHGFLSQDKKLLIIGCGNNGSILGMI